MIVSVFWWYDRIPKKINLKGGMISFLLTVLEVSVYSRLTLLLLCLWQDRNYMVEGLAEESCSSHG